MSGDYPVHGNAEWSVKTAWENVISNNLTITGIVTNIRKSRDVSETGNEGRSQMGISVDALCTSSIPETNDYMARVQIAVESRASVDESGQKIDAVIGGLRDIIHGGTYAAETDIVHQLNDAVRGFVFQRDGIKERDLIREDDDKVRRKILNVDCWGWVGEQT